MNESFLFDPTYYRPFGATPHIGGYNLTPISYACSICALLLKLLEIKQLDK